MAFESLSRRSFVSGSEILGKVVQTQARQKGGRSPSPDQLSFERKKLEWHRKLDMQERELISLKKTNFELIGSL